MSRKLITTSLAVVVVSAALWLGVYRQRAPRRPQKVLVVSKPRTVATLPNASRVTWYDSLSWLDRDTLIVCYTFRTGDSPRAGMPSCRLSGIVGVDSRTGQAESIRAPRPVDKSLATICTWSDRTASGQPASVRLPPAKFGDGGAISFDRPAASPANNRIAYNVDTIGPDGMGLSGSPHTGMWICRGDGSRARRVVSWNGRPQWSPDGHTLVLCSGEFLGGELWACRADGSGLRRIVERHAAGPQVSPDSRQVAFTNILGLGWFSVHVMNLRGGRAPLVVQDAREPVWACGSLLCQTGTSNKRFRALPWKRPARRRLTILNAISAIDPVTGWRTTVLPFLRGRSYDMVAPKKDTGLFVLAESLGAGHRDYWICALVADEMLRVALPRLVCPPAWSPDGRRLAYIEGTKIQVVDVALKRVKRP